CAPATCAGAGANCGMLADGCGGTLDCGTCPLPEACGGGGTPNVCGGCTPTTCAAAGANCGTIADGCGGTLDCGTCTLPETCSGSGTPNVCGIVPAGLGPMCCGRSDASGVCSGSSPAPGSGPGALCAPLGGRRFQWTAPPAGGEPCPSGVVFPFVTAGPCGPPATFPPTSFCCHPGVVVVGPCGTLVASDVAVLSDWLANACNDKGLYPAVVGDCVASTGAGTFVCAAGNWTPAAPCP